MTGTPHQESGIPTFDTTDVDAFMAAQEQVAQVMARRAEALQASEQRQQQLASEAGFIIDLMEHSAFASGPAEAAELLALCTVHGIGDASVFDLSPGALLVPSDRKSLLNDRMIKDPYDPRQTVRSLLLVLTAIGGIGFAHDDEARIIATYDRHVAPQYPQRKARKLLKRVKNEQNLRAASLSFAATKVWLRNRDGTKFSEIDTENRKQAHELANDAHSFYIRHFSSRLTRLLAEVG